MKYTQLIIGIAIGILAGSFFWAVWPRNRYQIYMMQYCVLKLDRYTGQTWRFNDDGWHPATNAPTGAVRIDFTPDKSN
jgi:hypothetical protein